jgi:Fic family protein
MKFPPIFSLTPSVSHLLYELDVLKAGYELHPVSREQEVSLKRTSLLKSSLFSARIEGNPLVLSDVLDVSQRDTDIHKTEIANLVSAYGQLSTIMSDLVTVDRLKQLHAIVLQHISGEAGHLRREESAIYNQAGVAVYLTPAPQGIRILLDELCICEHDKRCPACSGGGSPYMV